ncbi:MAG TPA: hypothetical protein VN040_17760 [Pseudosphingobacterium sp.]|nr:hypothetical protein [Pseudosphingobacterium sp.]
MKKVMEALLSSPGMEQEVKIDIRIPRKLVLFLCYSIEHGIKAKDSGAITNLMSTEMVAELNMLSEGFQEKAGLTTLQTHLSQLLEL